MTRHVTQTQYQGLALGLVLLAFWLRVWRLDQVPPGLWFDEAYNAMDAARMLDTGVWSVFLVGNHGREAMYHYLLAGSMTLLGETAYAVRVVSALLGVLSVPLMVRWLRTLFHGQSQGRWVALIGAAGLAVSFWYLVMNRAGYRANLLPLFILATGYFFWRGWQTSQLRYYALAGIALGLSQYTYFSARLLPLIFFLFLAGQTLMQSASKQPQLKRGWLGLLLMAGLSAVVALPLLLFIVQNPGAAWGRTLEVAIKVDGSGQSLRQFALHLLQAVRVFIDGEDPNWRHHLVGRPVLDWFSVVGFWLGLIVSLRRVRQPQYLLLLLLLLVMWLPAPLSNPPFHTLRLAGMLPAFYAIAAVGFISLGQWCSVRLSTGNQAGLWPVGLVILAATLLYSGGTTVYRYFFVWADHPTVRQEFEEQVVDLAAYLAGPNTNLVIPFYLYTHASIRYLLHNDFAEAVLLPEVERNELMQQPTTRLLMPAYPPDDGKPPAYVWLTKTAGQPTGTAYVSAVRRDMPLDRLADAPLESVYNEAGQEIGRLFELETARLAALFPAQLPPKQAEVTWADNLRLIRYGFEPLVVVAGQPVHLTLAWEILGHTELREEMFLQLIDSSGAPVGQQEVDAISRKMYRWRPDGLILDQHPLAAAPGLSPGLYFVRLGFFDPKSGQRLPAVGSENQVLGDQIIVGPLYVSADDEPLLKPQHSLQARLGHTFELLGYSIWPIEAENAMEIKLYWKSLAPVEVDYTVFVQLLDPNNQVLAQVDAQPLPGLFPTSHWQPGDQLPQRVVLPVVVEHLFGDDTRLVAGMYNLTTGERLPAYDDRGNLLPAGMVELR